MTLPELLAPVGDMDCLHAAIANGANAVYLGYAQFGARASASFDIETLQNAISLAHTHHVSVYITVNTLLKESEFSALGKVIQGLYQAKADAIITQDIGVASFAKENFPTLPLHASTQMALRNKNDVLFAKQFGFTRAVLARECTLSEMKSAAKTGVEIEVFVHGALCSSVSGQCLISAMAGGRSGNRGRCAQPCRQGYRLQGKQHALLALKDLCTIERLPELVQSGVHSLKIEGRLKNATYVATVVDAYRRGLDAIKEGKAFNASQAKERLLQVFNRGHFTLGHAFGQEDADLVSSERVSHEGLPMGRITAVHKGFAKMQTYRDLNDGDSLQIRNKLDNDMRYSGKGLLKGDIATLRIRPNVHIQIGDDVARLADRTLLDWASNRPFPKIPITLSADATEGKSLALTLSDGENVVTVYSNELERAKNNATPKESILKQLLKLGDTPCVLKNETATVNISGQPFVPVSLVNQLRRDGITKLLKTRAKTFYLKGQRAFPYPKTTPKLPTSLLSTNAIIAQFSNSDVGNILLKAGATNLWYQPQNLSPEYLTKNLAKLPKGTYLVFPNNLSEIDFNNLNNACKQATHLGGIVANSWGAFTLPYPIIAGPGIPITNKKGCFTLSQTQANAFTLWQEWNINEQQALYTKTPTPILTVYSKQTLMHLNHCPLRSEKGLYKKRNSCNLCKTSNAVCGFENPTLTSHLGHSYPLTRIETHYGCVIFLHNTLPTLLEENQVPPIPCAKLIQFFNETPEEMVSIVEHFSKHSPLHLQKTLGLYNKGVE